LGYDNPKGRFPVNLKLIGTALTATVGFSQVPPPAFDVISIRPALPSSSPVSRPVDYTPVLPHGGFRDTFIEPQMLIGFAYDLNLSRQLSGMPACAGKAFFSVEAKAAPDFPVLGVAENKAQVCLMLRTMLADRFHLKFHMETRPEKVFKMEVAKGGFKLNEVTPPVPPENVGFTFGVGADGGGGRLLGRKTNMARLALALSTMTGRTVVDETGVKGYYTFDIRWRGNLDPANKDLPPVGFATAEFTGPLLSTLQERFGLRLINGTGTVEVMVIDHIEPPDEN
jgi:uncharacterized protein (TIGR03435 family)